MASKPKAAGSAKIPIQDGQTSSETKSDCTYQEADNQDHKRAGAAPWQKFTNWLGFSKNKPEAGHKRLEDYPKKKKLAEETHSPSIPLVTRNQYSKSIVVNRDAIKLLSTITKPVAVLGICGPYRTGKSYFVSQVLGGDDFKVSHSNDPCTKGIWMSTSVLEFDDHVLILLDTEGTGAAQASESSSKEEVMSILILTTLLSSCLIYNTKGTIKESDVQEMRYLYKDKFS